MQSLKFVHFMTRVFRRIVKACMERRVFNPSLNSQLLMEVERSCVGSEFQKGDYVRGNLEKIGNSKTVISGN